MVTRTDFGKINLDLRNKAALKKTSLIGPRVEKNATRAVTFIPLASVPTVVPLPAPTFVSSPNWGFLGGRGKTWGREFWDC